MCRPCACDNDTASMIDVEDLRVQMEEQIEQARQHMMEQVELLRQEIDETTRD